LRAVSDDDHAWADYNAVANAADSRQMASNYISVSVVLLATLSLIAQSKPDRIIRRPAFEIGQVWTADQVVVMTVLAVEDTPKLGRIVHVRLDNVPWQTCGNFHLTKTMEHIAILEKMLLSSDLVLSKEDVDLPPSSVDAYRNWQGQKKPKIVRTSLQALIEAQGAMPGPMICNAVPAQTF